MQVRWRALGIAAIADETDHVARLHDAVVCELRRPVLEVRVVMAFTRRPQHPDLASAESAFAHRDHDAAGGTAYRSAARRENVHALMHTVAAARCTKRIGDTRGFDTLHRHWQRGGPGHSGQLPGRTRNL